MINNSDEEKEGNERMDQRLDRLERSCRRWRIAGITFAILVGAPLALFVFLLLTASPPHEVGQLIVRDRLVFLDSDRKVRLELGMRDKETPTIQFIDKNGQARLSLTLDKNGPFVWLSDKDQGVRREASLDDSDSPSLRFFEKGRRGPLLWMHIEPEGVPRLDFLDGPKLRMTMGLGKDGKPSILLIDENWKVRFIISLNKDGKPIISQPPSESDSREGNR